MKKIFLVLAILLFGNFVLASEVVILHTSDTHGRIVPIEYKDINKGFIGLPINKGNHNIEISYKTPFLNIGIALSVIGFITFAVIIVIDKRNKRKA